MIALIALIALTTQITPIANAPALSPAQATNNAATMPPQDWSTLPTLRFAKSVVEVPALAEFVRGEIKNGHCAAQRATAGGYALSVDVAVLITPHGLVRRTIPRAIGCPSVEQYAAGIAFSRAMGNVATDGMTEDGWYRTTMTFSWPG